MEKHQTLSWYDAKVLHELKAWQKEMQHKPSLLNKLSKKIQVKVNSWIPEKVHAAITATIKQMIRGVLFSAELITTKPTSFATLELKENAVEDFRKLIGATNPAQAEAGTIRALFARSVGENAVHGSDSDENAALESAFHFAGTEEY